MSSSDILSKFVKEIASMSKPKINVLKDGFEYFIPTGADEASRIEPFRFVPEIVRVSTLSGFVDAVNFVKANTDKEFISIKDPNRVSLISLHNEKDARLDEIISCVNFSQTPFSSNHYMDQETFITSVLVHFETTVELEKLLELVSNISRASEIKSVDNGAAQQLSVQDGIRLVQEKIENPITLKPRRTFYEVEQPKANYVIRFRKESDTVSMALFLVDDGKWQVEAINSIKLFLEEQKTGFTILA